jgi:hypothetical protein
MKNNRILGAICFLLFAAVLQTTVAQTPKKDTLKEVTSIGIIDTNETKSGFRINEYYIELSRQQLDSFRGKRVAVTGKLLIVPALDPEEKVISQGALSDRLFITDPKFTIVWDAREPGKE